MKTLSSFWLAANLSLIVGALNVPGNVAADDRRDDRRGDGYDSRYDRNSKQLKPQEGFEDIRWGANIGEVQKVLPNAHAKPLDAASPREKLYFVGSKIGVIPVELSLVFLDNKFGQAIMHFDGADAERVIDLFKECYGKPAAETAKAVTWNVSGTSILVVRAGVATVSSPEFAAYAERQQRFKDASRAFSGRAQ